MECENKVLFFLHFFWFRAIIRCILYVIKLSMKKTLIQLWQWILRNKKKLIYGALALFVGQICFFWLWWIGVENEVFAADDASQTQGSDFQKRVSEWYQNISFYQNVVYILIYPILVLAWKLVDNSWVYWAVFWFDAVLWNLWIIVRNIANFALWFLFIFYIFRYLIKQDSKKWPKWLIIRALIAGVWIQASWFIMAALIDMSTILTYWVWGLPISVLWNDKKNDSYVLKTLISVDVNNLDDMMGVYLTDVSTWNNHFYISECETFSYGMSWSDSKEELILAPKYIFYSEETGGKNVYHHTDKHRCHYFWQVYYFQNGQLYSWLNNWKFDCDNTNCTGWQSTYNTDMSNIKAELLGTTWTVIKWLINNWMILQIWDAHGESWMLWSNIWTWRYDGTGVWLDVDNKWTWEWKTTKLSNILDWKSYVWVFTTLYSSLINAWKWMVSSGWSLYTKFLNTVLSFLHMMAIATPLIAMCVVFMIRIAILWMVIALAPLVVLLTVFDLWWSGALKGMKFLEYFNPKNLLGIIFSPAVVCFAISMSAVLVRVIETLNVKDISAEASDIFWWLIHINIGWLWIWLWKFIVSAMWVAITWFLVRWAVQSSKIWESGIIKSIREITESALKSAPIVPIPWKDWAVSIGAIGKTIQTAKNKLNSYESDTEAIENLLNPKGQQEKWVENMYGKYKEWFGKWLIQDIDNTWMDKPVQIEGWREIRFGDLNEEQRKGIIQMINSDSEWKRKAFWARSTLNIGSEVYTFRGTIKVLDEQKKKQNVDINKYMTDKEFEDYLKNQKYTIETA